MKPEEDDDQQQRQDDDRVSEEEGNQKYFNYTNVDKHVMQPRMGMIRSRDDHDPLSVRVKLPTM